MRLNSKAPTGTTRALPWAVAVAVIGMVGWPIRVEAAGPCVAPPNDSCSLPCDVGGDVTRLIGTAAGSVGAHVQGCGHASTDCADGCVLEGTLTSGTWQCWGGNRGLTCETERIGGGGAK